MTFNVLSKYRAALMGIATLWVAVLHASMWFSTPILSVIKTTGHGGVDIFLFLSSFGLYYAWQKNERGSEFFLHRLKRILPAFVIIALFRCIYQHDSIGEILLKLSTLSFWIKGDRSIWYISAVVVLYALTPLYLKWFETGKQEKKTIVSVIVSLALVIPFRNTDQMIFIARIPIFLLGFLAGKYSYEKRTINWKELILMLVSFIAGCTILYFSMKLDHEEALLYGKGMYWYPNLLTVWPLCMMISWFLAQCSKVHLTVFQKFLEEFGKVSLEFYLLHETMIKIWSNVITVQERYNYHGIVFNLLVIMITYSVSWCLHQLIQRSIKLIRVNHS
ncbi:MAG: acyltransferase [Erysipelotrichia bacterium]|nr:acyltransferase [Erysipelotrichia bacterium]